MVRGSVVTAGRLEGGVVQEGGEGGVGGGGKVREARGAEDRQGAADGGAGPAQRAVHVDGGEGTG
jgi:hypothetical protein